jgi:hypothetical protein
MCDEQLTFGKFKGKYVSELPSYYVSWLAMNAHDSRIRKSAHDEYIHRNTWGRHWNRPHERKMS